MPRAQNDPVGVALRHAVDGGLDSPEGGVLPALCEGGDDDLVQRELGPVDLAVAQQVLHHAADLLARRLGEVGRECRVVDTVGLRQGQQNTSHGVDSPFSIYEPTFDSQAVIYGRLLLMIYII